MTRTRSDGAGRHSRFLVYTAALSAAFLAWTWLLSGQIRQLQWMLTYVTALASGIAVLFWFHRHSGLGRWGRWIPTAAASVSLLTFMTLVRVRGLTGDWHPVLEWRFADEAVWSAADKVRDGVDAAPVDISAPGAFPRFLGADFDSTVPAIGLHTDWEQRPPNLIWQRDVGSGWSGFAIAGGMAFTMEQRDDRETSVAYDLATGRELWSHGEVARFSNIEAGAGPRATPSLSPNRVFTFGATGILSALGIHTGELLWQRDVLVETDAPAMEFGKTGAPLLVDGMVVVNAGGSAGRSLMAYSQETGDVLWQAGDDHAAYAAPIVATLAGVRQIVVFYQATVAGHAIGDGAVLWQHAWPSMYPNAATPAVVGPNRVMFSTGYGVGSKVIEVRVDDGGSLSAHLVWESPRMKAKFTNLVLHDGYVYGLDDGVLTCIHPGTGERVWKRGRYGHGNILLTGDILLVQTEKGEMVMIDPSPDGHREISRFMALRGRAWSPFALAGRHLLVRNDKEAALWELP